MFVRIAVALVSVLLALAGCGGGGGGGGSPSTHAPAIANLSYSPVTVPQVPGGTATIIGSLDFTDAGGDVVAMRMASSAGADLTLPLAGTSGVTSGLLAGSFAVSVDQVGSYSFEVWLTDSRGSASNRLGGTFDVVPDDRAVTWTPIAVTPPGVLLGVARGSGKYVAVGNSGTVMTTTDLANWSVPASGVSHTLRSVAWSGLRYVAVGDNTDGEGVLLASGDGEAWTVRHRTGSCISTTCTAPSMLSKVIWAGTQFVAVGQEILNPGGPHAVILTSPDGLVWTRRAAGTVALGQVPTGPESAMRSVAWSGSLLVAVGLGPDDFPAAWTSTDAAVWARRTVPGLLGHNLRDVTWGQGRFVTGGWGGAPAAFSSADGITWLGNTNGIPLSGVNAMTAGPTRFLGVSNVFRATSTDGQAWTEVPSTDCGNGVLWDGLRYVSVGVSICRSP